MRGISSSSLWVHGAQWLPAVPALCPLWLNGTWFDSCDYAWHGWVCRDLPQFGECSSDLSEVTLWKWKLPGIRSPGQPLGFSRACPRQVCALARRCGRAAVEVSALQTSR